MEEANSWVRRTKFSHTVYHRIDPSRLASDRLDIEQYRKSGLKSRPPSTSPNTSSGPSLITIQRKPSHNKQRSASPLPQTLVSDVFKEAQSDRKRLSTPPPRMKDPNKVNLGQFFPKNYEEKERSDQRLRSDKNALRQISSLLFHDKTKVRKDSSWTKYFDPGSGKVTSVETAEGWIADLSKLFLGLRFAYGAHSQLYHGIYKDEAAAVKIIRVPDEDENGVLGVKLEKQFTREVTLLSRINHQNVIKFVAACRKPPVFVIITEYLSEGSLRTYLHKLGRRGLPLLKLIAVALDIARGMEYIHSQGIIHRDLKPENILINQDFQMKIADFGIACEEKLCDLLADDPGTYRWMAPEMIKRKSYGRKVDVYSFGLILWEMVAGTIPYEDMTPIQAAFAVVNKNMRPVIPSDCPPSMKALIEQCWCLQPEKRPDFWQLVKVLEHFEHVLARDGNLNLVLSPSCQDHKKGLLRLIQKLSPKPNPKSK